MTAQLCACTSIQNNDYRISKHTVKTVQSRVKTDKASFSKEGCHSQELPVTGPSRLWQSVKCFRSPSGLQTSQTPFNEGGMAPRISKAIHSQILLMYLQLLRLEPENTLKGIVAALPFPLWFPTSAWQLIVFTWEFLQHDSSASSHSFPGSVDVESWPTQGVIWAHSLQNSSYV